MEGAPAAGLHLLGTMEVPQWGPGEGSSLRSSVGFLLASSLRFFCVVPPQVLGSWVGPGSCTEV